MKNLNKLRINSDRLMNNEELISLRVNMTWKQDVFVNGGSLAALAHV